MQQAALDAAGLGEGWRYQLLPVPPELLAETVRALPGAGFAGANATIPHKEAALALADEASPAAREIGAANTLSFAGGRVAADNTDAPGLVAALPGPPPGSALVLGAGGSARAAAYALRRLGAAVSVLNRTRDRAEALAADLGVQAVSAPHPADLLVNCTSVGLADPAVCPIDPAWTADFAIVADLVYGPRETALIGAARAAGAETVDGREVLVRQGALSFERWTGRPAPLEVMRRAILG